MKSGQVVLSKRLQMLADMVTAGNAVADVGCDHGFLSVYLVQKKISPHVLAMDVRKGPLEAAAEHIGIYGLGEYIDIRLSDGLRELKEGEADAAVCAGMGGRLMEKILTESMEKARGMKELILQPQSEIREFRAFLRREGFRIVEENVVYEEGKYYFAMRVVYSEGGTCGGAAGDSVGNTGDVWQDIFDGYGELLLQRKHPVLKQYLLSRREVVTQILEKLKAADGKRTEERLMEIRQELSEIETALGQFREW